MEEPVHFKDQPDKFSRNPDPIREQSLERSLPNSTEAECAVLGAIILYNVLLMQAIELLTPEDFYVPSHRKIFIAMIALFERGENIDPILIGEELKKQNQLESVGGISFITNLTYGLPHSTNIAHYAKVIRGKSLLRQLIKTHSKGIAEALEQEDEPEVILDRAEHAIFELSDERYTTELVQLSTISSGVVEAAEQHVGHGLTATGLSIGFIDIDQMTAGFQRSELIIVAARPSVGKTSLGTSIINNVGVHDGKHVAFFTLEMSKDAIYQRMLCSEAGVGHQVFRNGLLNHEAWDRLYAARELLDASKIFIDDKPDISVLEVRMKVKRLTLQHGAPDLIVIDYLQLMSGTKEHRKENRQQEIAGISRGLKALAKEIDRPVLALAQLNRASELSTDKRPQLHHLRESGAIEMDADLVALLYRDVPKYNQDAPQEYEPTAVVEFIIAKQRNGPCGQIGLQFDKSTMRFHNLQNEHY